MREIASINPTRKERDNFIAVGRTLETRQMTPDLDHILPEDDLAWVVNNLNTDAKVATMLLVSFGGLHTARGIADFMNAQSQDGNPVIGRTTVRKILTNFAAEGLLDVEQVGKSLEFSKPATMDCYAAQAGFLGDLSRRYPASIHDIFGHAENVRRRDGTEDTKEMALAHTKDRMRLIKLLYLAKDRKNPYIPLPLTQSKIAEELGVSEDIARGHLDALAAVGALSYDSVDTSKGDFQRYHLNGSHDSRNLKSKESYPLAHAVRDFAKGQEEFTAGDALSHVLSLVDEKQGFSDTESKMLGIPFGQAELAEEDIKRLHIKVRKVVAYLRDTHVVQPSTSFSRQSKSVIQFVPKTEQIALLRDTVLTLFDVRQENHNGEVRGLSMGARVTGDAAGMSRILAKVQQENNSYSFRSAPDTAPENR